MKAVRHILAVKPSSFGDIVHTFPALALLKQSFPEAELDFLVNPEFVPLLDYSPFPVRRKILFERRKLGKIFLLLPELFKLIRKLRRTRYDLVIDFQGLLRSAICCRLCRAEQIAGFAAPRERSARFCYTRRFPIAPGHAVQRCAELAASAAGVPPVLLQPDLPLQEDARRSVLRKLGDTPAGYVVYLPGTRWESKRFPPRLFAQITTLLHTRYPKLVFAAAGSRSEKALAEAIGPDVRVLSGETAIPELMELLRGAALVIGNDSGPLHAAAALKRPVFGFYGPTDPVRTGPCGEQVRIFSAKAECAPCLCRKCPSDNRCHNLDAEKIAAAAAEILEKYRR